MADSEMSDGDRLGGDDDPTQYANPATYYDNKFPPRVNYGAVSNDSAIEEAMGFDRTELASFKAELRRIYKDRLNSVKTNYQGSASKNSKAEHIKIVRASFKTPATLRKAPAAVVDGFICAQLGKISTAVHAGSRKAGKLPKRGLSPNRKETPAKRSRVGQKGELESRLFGRKEEEEAVQQNAAQSQHGALSIRIHPRVPIDLRQFMDDEDRPQWAWFCAGMTEIYELEDPKKLYCFMGPQKYMKNRIHTEKTWRSVLQALTMDGTQEVAVSLKELPVPLPPFDPDTAQDAPIVTPGVQILRGAAPDAGTMLLDTPTEHKTEAAAETPVDLVDAAADLDTLPPSQTLRPTSTRFLRPSRRVPLLLCPL
ncbi:hypothetical protein NX059_012358 [Plenodomus lindquistii]|nr:hypothetical protein NX059_012358 [Plenodomus lindquistii]